MEADVLYTVIFKSSWSHPVHIALHIHHTLLAFIKNEKTKSNIFWIHLKELCKNLKMKRDYNQYFLNLSLTADCLIFPLVQLIKKKLIN